MKTNNVAIAGIIIGVVALGIGYFLFNYALNICSNTAPLPVTPGLELPFSDKAIAFMNCNIENPMIMLYQVIAISAAGTGISVFIVGIKNIFA